MLIIFVDAWPYKYAPRNLQCKPLKPNLGHSVNLHNEIFAGKSPDDMGFFGEYHRNPGVSGQSKLGKLADFILPQRFAGLFKVALRKFFNIRIGQLPFADLALYERKGKYPFIGESPSLIENFRSYITDSMKNIGLGKRDLIAVNSLLRDFRSKKIADNENIFISLCDLDGLGHKYGVGSSEYQRHLSLLEGWISEIIFEYQTLSKTAKYFLLSDHGMMNVEKHIDIREWVKRMEGKYRCNIFYDSLYVYVHSSSLLSPQNLQEIEEVSWFNEDERKRFGITNKSFGVHIGVMKPGFALSPNKFGFSKMKAYHGFLPSNDLKENFGIVASNASLPDEITSKLMFTILNENL